MINTGLLSLVATTLFLSSLCVITVLYIIPKQKFKKSEKTNNVPDKTITENKTETVIHRPSITVLIADNKNEKQLISEIADMYINERTFFYTGKVFQNIDQRSEKEIFIKHGTVSWNSLEMYEQKIIT